MLNFLFLFYLFGVKRHRIRLFIILGVMHDNLFGIFFKHYQIFLDLLLHRVPTLPAMYACLNTFPHPGLRGGVSD